MQVLLPLHLRLKAMSGKSKVTLQDIARALGVSKATVSLAMNDSTLVADKTKKLVRQKSEELGYVYNRGAAGLSTGETRTIGLAVHDFSNPYFISLCESVEAVLSMSGRMSFLCNTDESLERQARFINELVAHNADGLILGPAVGTTLDDLKPLLDRKVPIVLLGRDVVGAPVDLVRNDDQRALMLATQHIISQGHHRIAMLGGSKNTTVGHNRRAGFLQAMESAGVEVDPDFLIDCEPTTAGGLAAAQALMAKNELPTALVCFNDMVALGAMSALCDMGRAPGKDIAVIGCDNVEEGGRSYIGLSTVQVQKEAIGHEAAEILVNRLDNPETELRRVVKEPTLLVRKTCGMQLNKPE